MTADDWLDILGFSEEEQNQIDAEANEAELDFTSREWASNA